MIKAHRNNCHCSCSIFIAFCQHQDVEIASEGKTITESVRLRQDRGIYQIEARKSRGDSIQKQRRKLTKLPKAYLQLLNYSNQLLTPTTKLP